MRPDLERTFEHAFHLSLPIAVHAFTHTDGDPQGFLRHTTSTDALAAETTRITKDNCLCIFPHVCSLLSLTSIGLDSSGSFRTINRN